MTPPLDSMPVHGAVHSAADQQAQLLEDLRSAIVAIGMVAYQGPDPVTTLLLEELQLPEHVALIATVLGPADPRDYPPQDLGSALHRLCVSVIGAGHLERATQGAQPRGESPGPLAASARAMDTETCTESQQRSGEPRRETSCV